jgi:hypothetical protein
MTYALNAQHYTPLLLGTPWVPSDGSYGFSCAPNKYVEKSIHSFESRRYSKVKDTQEQEFWHPRVRYGIKVILPKIYTRTLFNGENYCYDANI